MNELEDLKLMHRKELSLMHKMINEKTLENISVVKENRELKELQKVDRREIIGMRIFSTLLGLLVIYLVYNSIAGV